VAASEITNLENTQFQSPQNPVNISEVRARFSSYFEGNFRFFLLIPFKVLIRNVFYSEGWRRSLDSLDVISKNVSQWLECVELNKFESVASESELEQRGLELMNVNKLWAGLVFNDIEEG